MVLCLWGLLIAWVQKSVSQVEAWPHDTNSQPRNKFYFWRAFEEDGKIMFLFVFEFHIYRHIFIWKNPELLQVPTLILWHLAEILLHLDCNLNYSLSFPSPLSLPSLSLLSLLSLPLDKMAFNKKYMVVQKEIKKWWSL